jgi:hypothetical protein
MITEKTLWFTTEQPRAYFLVPGDAALPAGTLSVRSLLGEEKAVDATSLQSFAISEEKAKAVLRADIMHMLEQLPDALSDVMAQLDAQSFSVGGLLDTLPPSVEFSQADVSVLVDALRGAFARGGLQAQSPEEFLAQMEAQGPEGVIAVVNQLGEWLSQGSEDESRQVNQVLDRLNRQLSRMVESDQPHYGIGDEERRRYRESARRSIADSLRRVGFHPCPHHRSEH